jgi:hypothetical protein
MELMSLPAAILALAAMVSALALRKHARHRRLFAGFEGISREVMAIARALVAQAVREDEDIVVAGDYEGYPLRVQFSTVKGSPALQIRMPAPLSFTLCIMPRWIAQPVLGNTTAIPWSFDKAFHNRFRVQTDNREAAHDFLGIRNVRDQIQNLCCSTRTLLMLRSGSIELVHMELPPRVAQHILQHARSMAALAAVAAEMPNAPVLTMEGRTRRPRRWALKTAAVLGTSVLFGYVLSAYGFFDVSTTAGQPAGEAQTTKDLQVPVLKNWKLAEIQDFDANLVQWLAAQDQLPVSQLRLDTEEPEPTMAYLLTGLDGSKRVVLLHHGRLLYDSRFLRLAGIARVPKVAMAQVRWSNTSDPEPLPTSDGLLLVPDTTDVASARILFTIQDRVSAAAPVDFREIILH